MKKTSIKVKFIPSKDDHFLTSKELDVYLNNKNHPCIKLNGIIYLLNSDKTHLYEFKTYIGTIHTLSGKDDLEYYLSNPSLETV